MAVPYFVPQRVVPGSGSPLPHAGGGVGVVTGFYTNSVIGLPAQVGNGQVFDSNVLFVAGYNRFMLTMKVTGPPPLPTVENRVIILDPEAASVTQLTSDFLFAGSGPLDRSVWGAGTGVLDPFPWIAIQIEVTSNDGGIVLPNAISWQMYLSRV